MLKRKKKNKFGIKLRKILSKEQIAQNEMYFNELRFLGCLKKYPNWQSYLESLYKEINKLRQKRIKNNSKVVKK